MTLPSSGTISLSNVNVEIGATATTLRGMDWVKANTKDAVTKFNGLYGRAWYALSGDSRSYLQSNCNCDCNCVCVTNCG